MGKRKTNEQFKKEVEELGGGLYTLLDTYKGSREKVRLRHEVCGNIYLVKPNVFLQGNRCPYCYGTHKKTTEQFKKEVFEIVGNDYQVLGEYKNNKTKLKFRHLVCGNNFLMTPSNFLLKGQRCPICANKTRGPHKDTFNFKKEVYELVGHEYQVLGVYKGNKKKILIKHIKCGHSYLVRPNDFITGYRCPYCSQSRGEHIIGKILCSFDIKYEYPKKFADLKDSHTLHYDFYIPGQRILIEYQGKQHYQPVEHFGGNESFKKQQFHDNLKRRYAREHGYNLIEVPYTINTSKEIKIYLAKHGLILSNKITHNSLHFKRVAPQEVHGLMLNYHYLHRVVRCTFAYAMYYDDNIVGMVTYSKVRKSVYKSISDNATINNTLELSRLYIKDEVSQTVPNITSQFVSWSLRQLRKLGNWYIISFADSGMHHVGAIYQATNFLYCGTTRKGIFCYNGPHKKGGQWKAGVHYRFFIIRSKKYRYVKFVGSKSFKKGARKELRLKVQSYPKADKVHYSIGDTEERFIRDRKTNKIYSEKELLKTFPNYNWSKGDEW